MIDKHKEWCTWFMNNKSCTCKPTKERVMMRNTIPDRFKNNIEERPESLTPRKNSEQYDDLANTLRVLEATSSVVLSESEATGLFGKFYKTSVRNQMKKRGLEKPRIAVKNGRVHIWLTKV